MIGTRSIGQFNCEYYGTSKDPGYAWCAVFQWWLFKQLGMSELYYGGGKTASCNTLYNYHKALGQAVTDYKPGDLIFFDTTGRHSSINHVGLCESFNGTTMISIDGNTSGTNGTSDNNGGSVNRRSRNAKIYVMAAIRPKYEVFEGELTVSQYNELLAEVEALKAKLAPIYATIDDVPEWGKAAVQDAIDRNILKGVDKNMLGLSWAEVRSMVFDYRRENSVITPVFVEGE